MNVPTCAWITRPSIVHRQWRLAEAFVQWLSLLALLRSMPNGAGRRRGRGDAWKTRPIALSAKASALLLSWGVPILLYFGRKLFFKPKIFFYKVYVVQRTCFDCN